MPDEAAALPLAKQSPPPGQQQYGPLRVQVICPDCSIEPDSAHMPGCVCVWGVGGGGGVGLAPQGMMLR